MWTENGGVMGVGYEGKTVAELLAGLSAMRVTTLVDVRLNAISRKAGFSKRALAAAAEEAGITYLHRPQLGNPRDNRDGFAESTSSEAGRAARSTYCQAIAEAEGTATINEIAALAASERVALLCFEASELNCHRREALSAIRDKLWSLVEA